MSLVLSDGVEALADQDFEVCLGFGNGIKSLPPTGLRFDIADPHFQMRARRPHSCG